MTSTSRQKLATWFAAAMTPPENTSRLSNWEAMMFSFAAFPHRPDVLILVDDGVADKHNPIILDRFDQILASPLQAAVAAHTIEKIAQRRIVDVEISVDQRGRAESDVLGEDKPAAVFLDSIFLVDDPAGNIVLGIFVVRSLDVDSRLDGLEDDSPPTGRD